jgi:N-glycosidase YbiA
MIWSMQVIHFYDESQPFGWCSNFASCPIAVDGLLWPTTEHYYQAMKYAGTSYAEVIRQAPSPMAAKLLTRDPAHPPRADWDAVKDRTMHDALLAKFTQHAHLRSLLLQTGDALLVEHTQNDHYWADGGDGSGQNMLGRILMAVRAELRAQAQWQA